ncbi:hypothetical protein GYB29_01230 [bacterium]|nr:hypothetical protein [bacterium]
MNKLAYFFLLSCFCVSCSTNRNNIDGCSSYSSSEEFKFYSKSLSNNWLLREIHPDSVEIFFFETVFDYHTDFSKTDTSSTELTDDERKVLKWEKQRSKQSAESFLNHYESGDKIWSFNNAPSKPGNLGWEYGVLILNGCNIKYVQPIIVS